MKSRFLFPHYFRLVGVLFFVLHIAFAIVLIVLHPEGYSKAVGQAEPFQMLLHNDINILLVVLGLLFIAFAKETIEDEQIAQLRLDSLQWAIYLNYTVFILCVIFINGMPFINIVAYNVITPLIIFIIRFRWKIYQLNRLVKQS